jgi:hypothetical protein
MSLEMPIMYMLLYMYPVVCRYMMNSTYYTSKLLYNCILNCIKLRKIE